MQEGFNKKLLGARSDVDGLVSFHDFYSASKAAAVHSTPTFGGLDRSVHTMGLFGLRGGLARTAQVQITGVTQAEWHGVVGGDPPLALPRSARTLGPPCTFAIDEADQMAGSSHRVLFAPTMYAIIDGTRYTIPHRGRSTIYAMRFHIIVPDGAVPAAEDAHMGGGGAGMMLGAAAVAAPAAAAGATRRLTAEGGLTSSSSDDDDNDGLTAPAGTASTVLRLGHRTWEFAQR